ncbi:SpaH/EbpB family LPXTG-anchored major pilin [Microbacterium trichothecenolyticum]|uniref:Fimbrial isopeptide formation D2 family protein n=1 Tax=Microbacterium trichothecenolyticum TaxID=69370 RepID=A0ABU0TW11_MICTR|nr:SpaH/EbpB family LPXTG-anchored major pilin [Microbacterium trichothecenolyticum]MDQ1123841.1 fimbrial isopeptide formation D2 family protein [Microbacterium trichothecenolyticum]
MVRRSSLLRSVAAGLGIAALAALGVAAAPAANAAGPSPSNITGTTGTLTIHKHAGDPGAAGDGTEITDPAKIAALGQALEGVQFSVQRVNYSGSPIDLTTAAGWDVAQNVTPANVSQSPYSLGAQTSVTTDASGVAVVSNLPYGLYYVTETGPGANPIVSPVQPFLVSVPYPDQGTWLYDVHVYPKNKLNDTTPTKTVAAPSAPTLGSTIVWTVNAPIAPIAADDTYRSFSITDTLDSRLTYIGAVVKIDGTTLTEGTDYTVTNNVKIVFTATGLSKLAGKTAVTADITTRVDSLGTNGEITNTAIVNTNGSDRTTNTPQTNWGALTIVKQDATTSNTLQGAQFEVYDARDGALVAGPFTTDSDGKISVPGLWVGNNDTKSRDYWLKETKAPAGYVLPADPWRQVTVTANGTSGTPTSVTVPNTQQAGPNLPLTGGGGSALFTAIGLGLLATGVGTLVVRRLRAARR